MANTPFIQLQDIAKTYDDGYTACSNININIEKGKFVTILGPSGCGKTTLLKMLAGFEMPTKGKIIVNGIDIKDLPIHMRPTATVFQDYALFPNMTIYENICYGLKIMRTELDKVPDKVYKELEKAKRDAIIKSSKEIEILKNDLVKIDKEILKTKLFYNKSPELFKIQDMRYSQFQAQVLHYENLMKRKDPEYSGFQLSAKNKRKVLRFRFNSKFGARMKIKFDLRGLEKPEKQICELLSLYLFKEKTDKKVDELYAKYADKDQWISYWQNYPNLVVEQFQKLHTTRLLTKEEISQKAKEAIELVGLTGNEKKFPKDLSGGMQQRVALARAIVIKPEILLLDEPLSALDAKVRHKMQEELKRIHNELKINFILVTHDQEEALRLSDQIIVMSRGKVEQFGSAKSIYEHPVNTWVANFIGQANFVECTYLGKEKVKIGQKVLNYPITNKELEARLVKNSTFKLLIRPEDIEICSPHRAYMMMRVQSILYKGTVYEVHCISKDKVQLTLQTTNSVSANELIGVRWNFKYSTPILPKKGENK